jgi:hypothetical protein
MQIFFYAEENCKILIACGINNPDNLPGNTEVCDGQDRTGQKYLEKKNPFLLDEN